MIPRWGSIPESASLLAGHPLTSTVGPYPGGASPWKCACVVTPDSPDIGLEDVAASLRAMQEAGMVEIVSR